MGPPVTPGTGLNMLHVPEYIGDKLYSFYGTPEVMICLIPNVLERCKSRTCQSGALSSIYVVTVTRFQGTNLNSSDGDLPGHLLWNLVSSSPELQ